MHDCSHLVTGSPSLPDKYRHAREMMLLLPTHRDRPSSAMYPAAILENGQVVHPASSPPSAAGELAWAPLIALAGLAFYTAPHACPLLL